MMTPIEQINWAREILGAAKPETAGEAIKRLTGENWRLTEALKIVTRSRDDAVDEARENFRVKEHWRGRAESLQSALNAAGRVGMSHADMISDLKAEISRLKKRVNGMIRKGKASK